MILDQWGKPVPIEHVRRSVGFIGPKHRPLNLGEMCAVPQANGEYEGRWIESESSGHQQPYNQEPECKPFKSSSTFPHLMGAKPR